MRRASVEREKKMRRLIGDAEHAQPVRGLPESFRSPVRTINFYGVLGRKGKR
jgi:hypothetical protein